MAREYSAHPGWKQQALDLLKLKCAWMQSE